MQLLGRIFVHQTGNDDMEGVGFTGAGSSRHQCMNAVIPQPDSLRLVSPGQHPQPDINAVLRGGKPDLTPIHMGEFAYINGLTYAVLLQKLLRHLPGLVHLFFSLDTLPYNGQLRTYPYFCVPVSILQVFSKRQTNAVLSLVFFLAALLTDIVGQPVLVFLKSENILSFCFSLFFL